MVENFRRKTLGFRTLLAAGAMSVLLSACAASEHKSAPASVKAPGQLIETAPLDAQLSLPGAARSLKITYLSTNGITGSGLVPVTAEVILPPGTPPAGGWPIVAWSHGTVGIAESCAPSLHPYTERNRDYLSAWMQRGFAIVATDYQGLGSGGPHPYLNVRTEAYSVLDSVRAALAGVPGLQNKVMLVGQSQGAGAAFGAAAYAPDYAPDLNIRGTVATGIPYMTPEVLSALLTHQEQTSPKAKQAIQKQDPVVAYGLLLGASLGNIDPNFKPEEAFTPKAMDAYHAASQVCLAPLMQQVSKDGLTRRNAFTPTMGKALAPAFKGMMYPTLALKQPLFVGTGSQDLDVAASSQKALVKAACAAGTTVQAHVYKGLDHSQTVLASLPDSAAFTQAVMAGEPVSGSCTVSTP
ncbi:secretory lipase [Acetobacter senegalensis]|uniref:Secretory lipase n=2 Tax=Acetobacter senegalensis TaxID=446692 RepID=A0A0U5BDE0_9PROT|nr:secretory lipase [Acetobacter senegalensis]